MSWNPHSEVHYLNTSYPYNSAGSFMEYFEGLTYQHVNFIFDGASHVQDSVYPSVHTSFYKFGISDSGNFSYYDHGHTFPVSDHEPRTEEYRRPVDNSARMTNDRAAAANREWEQYENTTAHENILGESFYNPHIPGVIKQLIVKSDGGYNYERKMSSSGSTYGSQFLRSKGKKRKRICGHVNNCKADPLLR